MEARKQEILTALEKKDYAGIDKLHLSPNEAQWMFQQQQILNTTRELDEVLSPTFNPEKLSLFVTSQKPVTLTVSAKKNKLHAQLEKAKDYTEHQLAQIEEWLFPKAFVYSRSNNQTSEENIITTEYFTVTQISYEQGTLFELTFINETTQIKIKQLDGNFSTSERGARNQLKPLLLKTGTYQVQINGLNLLTLELQLAEKT